MLGESKDSIPPFGRPGQRHLEISHWRHQPKTPFAFLQLAGRKRVVFLDFIAKEVYRRCLEIPRFHLSFLGLTTFIEEKRRRFQRDGMDMRGTMEATKSLVVKHGVQVVVADAAVRWFDSGLHPDAISSTRLPLTPHWPNQPLGTITRAALLKYGSLI